MFAGMLPSFLGSPITLTYLLSLALVFSFSNITS
uniref:Uncharacterized protein n=1 Tax=Anguilla anguilla TaxID=7936 RepID=A0A0E9W3A8_ANGAN